MNEEEKKTECSSNNGLAMFWEKTFVYDMPEE